MSRQQALKNERPVSGGIEPPRVLIVDDDPGILMIMDKTLSDAGFDTMSVETGVDAVRACPAFKPNLVLLDIDMPQMDGITACAEIRRYNSVAFPIVMVTSMDDADSIRRAFDAGATDFILKPLNWPLFQRRINAVLTEWEQSKEPAESDRRAQLLEKVAPEQVLLVSKAGIVIDDLKKRAPLELAAPSRTDQTLEDLFGADVAGRFRQRISGVLKTRRDNSLRFVRTIDGESRAYEAQFLVDGRDRVMIVLQQAAVASPGDTGIFAPLVDPSVPLLPGREQLLLHAEEALVNARLHGYSVIFFGLRFDDVSEEDLGNRSVLGSAISRLENSLTQIGAAVSFGNSFDAPRVCHVGDKEFMFVLQRVRDAVDVTSICHQLLRQFEEPIRLEDRSVMISPRLGIAAFPADGRNARTLEASARSAMLEAWETGVSLCSSSGAATLDNIRSLDYGAELQRALDNGELELYFQPRLTMPGDVTCVEALLRWNHPMRGYVGLAEVLDIAKSTGLMVPLGDWVVSTACSEAAAWKPPLAPRISINLSQQEFMRDDLPERVTEVLQETGLEPGRVEFEFTERSLLRSGHAFETLQALAGVGVGLALDNFGTGHTSLAHLKHYPISALKIDGSFVCELPASDKDAAICEVIITMAHKLGMRAIAEGVETADQMRLLNDLGCDEFQGYLLSPPLPPDELRAFLEQSAGSTTPPA